MGQLLHGSATTTEAVRRAIQARQESVRAAAKRFGISPTTVQKWRKRQTTADARMGPKAIRSTVLTVEEEAVIVAFRRHALLPLDDCLYALQPTFLAFGLCDTLRFDALSSSSASRKACRVCLTGPGS